MNRSIREKARSRRIIVLQTIKAKRNGFDPKIVSIKQPKQTRFQPVDRILDSFDLSSRFASA